ncbi:mitochondrial 37S ribosomal protein mS47 [Aspergillus novofumigatus IBT 16806]|uniref:3-hydroxyisobutyryl-CoA hydrolase n=1 Tax=Aspergillus novofumigatus (strain IBT 16806) TaxID=1392255 RepID=A0A2I1CJ02_ASPN1|nr:putative mitochondrial 3-hydroxyisobutyryl-CoA hydrolase [Aspergillus novofumigatus IBT 16806]PKX97574.1 putative mitochondrial 3-hydroxyisobutyryl-CoA hydrolase [Aspergillus novofumigatus IBT 16806]
MPLRAKVTNPAFGAAAKMSTAPELPKELPGDEPDDVLFSSLYGVRLIELNRPKKLNSLNGSMARKILPRLKEWEKSQLANIVMLSGAGTKALCAGGDVASLALQNEQGPEGQQKSTDFFGLEYRLDHIIATYAKPFISVMDGITMGGGVGLSVHAPFRIATERTVFAMPETTIGFFPDVGGSFFLPRLDGEIGTYLALTSERLNGVQALYAGVATHYFHSSVLSNLTARLAELVFRDHASLAERLDLVNKTMAEFSVGLPPVEQEPIHLAGSLRTAIDRCFKHKTVEEIFRALEQETVQKEWAQKTLETLSSRSPTSLKVTLRQMRVGKHWSISETFQREYQIAAQFMKHPDFVEGVKARLMSKPPRQATWQPATLEEVTSDAVDAFFKLPEGESRLALFNKTDYKQYPHAYGLPSEAEIEKFVRDSSESASKTVADFVEKWGHKEGAREKVAEVLARRTVQTPEGLRWE